MTTTCSSEMETHDIIYTLNQISSKAPPPKILHFSGMSARKIPFILKSISSWVFNIGNTNCSNHYIPTPSTANLLLPPLTY